MDRRNVSSIMNLPFELNFRKFARQENKITRAINGTIKENNDNELFINGVCYYNNYVGEDNVQVYSQDGYISFYSTYDEKYFSPYCFGSFSGVKSGSNVSFYLQAQDKDSFLAKYSITEILKNNQIQVTRGLQLFEGEKVLTLENSVIKNSEGEPIYAHSTFTKTLGENEESEIILNATKSELEKLDLENQSNLDQFRKDLFYLRGSDQIYAVNGLFASRDESNQIIDGVNSFIDKYCPLLQESQETQEN